MRTLLKLIDGISNWTGRMSSFLVLVITGVILYEVIARYVFGTPTIWAYEVSLALYGIYVALIGAYALVQGAHVNVDIVYSRFSPRTRAGMSVFTWLIFFLWCGVLVWTGWIRGWDSLMIGERESTAFGCPIYPVKLSLAVGGALLFLQGAAGYVRNVYTLITGEKLD
ncbi:MAG: TRAP transporter small permease subunit [Deltaproteobacteria bacterium]|nr:TRAP transporter small permease subunit [Deltaproteobacteria bacterium]